MTRIYDVSLVVVVNAKRHLICCIRGKERKAYNGA